MGNLTSLPLACWGCLAFPDCISARGASTSAVLHRHVVTTVPWAGCRRRHLQGLPVSVPPSIAPVFGQLDRWDRWTSAPPGSFLLHAGQPVRLFRHPDRRGPTAPSWPMTRHFLRMKQALVVDSVSSGLWRLHGDPVRDGLHREQPGKSPSAVAPAPTAIVVASCSCWPSSPVAAMVPAYAAAGPPSTWAC